MTVASGEGGASEAGTPARLPDVVRLLRGWLPVLAGVILLIACYLGVSGESEVSRQLPYLVSGGFGGLALVIVGSALLVIDGLAGDSGRQLLARQVDDLHTLILSAADAPGGPPAVPATRSPGGYAGPAGGAGSPTASAPAATPGAGAAEEHGAHQAFDHFDVDATATGAAAGGATAAAAGATTGGAAGATAGGAEWVAVAGGRTFHRPDCKLVDGKPAEPVSPADVEARGLSACRLCTPLATTAS